MFFCIIVTYLLCQFYFWSIFFGREEELQLQKLKKRKIKADPRLSFADEFENDNEEEDEENRKHLWMKCCWAFFFVSWVYWHKHTFKLQSLTYYTWPIFIENDDIRQRFGKYGKDPTVETSFLPDRLEFLSSHFCWTCLFMLSWPIWIPMPCFSIFYL